MYDTEAYRSAEAAWDQSASGQLENAEMVTLVAAIDEERARQIEGMQAVMRRFVEALHGVDP